MSTERRLLVTVFDLVGFAADCSVSKTVIQLLTRIK